MNADETHKEPTPFVTAFWIALAVLGLPCITALMIIVNWYPQALDWVTK